MAIFDEVTRFKIDDVCPKDINIKPYDQCHHVRVKTYPNIDIRFTINALDKDIYIVEYRYSDMPNDTWHIVKNLILDIKKTDNYALNSRIQTTEYPGYKKINQTLYDKNNLDNYLYYDRLYSRIHRIIRGGIFGVEFGASYEVKIVDHEPTIMDFDKEFTLCKFNNVYYKIKNPANNDNTIEKWFMLSDFVTSVFDSINVKETNFSEGYLPLMVLRDSYRNDDNECEMHISYYRNYYTMGFEGYTPIDLERTTRDIIFHRKLKILDEFPDWEKYQPEHEPDTVFTSNFSKNYITYVANWFTAETSTGVRTWAYKLNTYNPNEKYGEYMKSLKPDYIEEISTNDKLTDAGLSYGFTDEGYLTDPVTELRYTKLYFNNIKLNKDYEIMILDPDAVPTDNVMKFIIKPEIFDISDYSVDYIWSKHNRLRYNIEYIKSGLLYNGLGDIPIGSTYKWNAEFTDEVSSDIFSLSKISPAIDTIHEFDPDDPDELKVKINYDYTPTPDKYFTNKLELSHSDLTETYEIDLLGTNWESSYIREYSMYGYYGDGIIIYDRNGNVRASYVGIDIEYNNYDKIHVWHFYTDIEDEYEDYIPEHLTITMQNSTLTVSLDDFFAFNCWSIGKIVFKEVHIEAYRKDIKDIGYPNIKYKIYDINSKEYDVKNESIDIIINPND